MDAATISLHKSLIERSDKLAAVHGADAATAAIGIVRLSTITPIVRAMLEACRSGRQDALSELEDQLTTAMAAVSMQLCSRLNREATADVRVAVVEMLSIAVAQGAATAAPNNT